MSAPVQWQVRPAHAGRDEGWQILRNSHLHATRESMDDAALEATELAVSDAAANGAATLRVVDRAGRVRVDREFAA